MRLTCYKWRRNGKIWQALMGEGVNQMTLTRALASAVMLYLQTRPRSGFSKCLPPVVYPLGGMPE